MSRITKRTEKGAYLVTLPGGNKTALRGIAGRNAADREAEAQGCKPVGEWLPMGDGSYEREYESDPVLEAGVRLHAEHDRVVDEWHYRQTAPTKYGPAGTVKPDYETVAANVVAGRKPWDFPEPYTPPPLTDAERIAQLEAELASRAPRAVVPR